MSKLADEIIAKLFTDRIGNPVSRLIQEGAGTGWSENAVRDIIEDAEKSARSTGLESYSLEELHAAVCRRRYVA